MTSNEPAILQFVGDVDIASEHEWRQRGDEHLAANSADRDVVVDMREVGFLDSRGLAVLVHLHSKALERGGALTLIGLPHRVRKALTVAGLDQVFVMQDA